MARIVTVVDDLDKSEDDVQQVEFTYGGKRYEIDLGKKNRDAMDKAMKKYLDAATELGEAIVPKAATATTTARAKHLARVRDWAGKNKFEVSDRGRIPDDVREAYNTANPEDKLEA
jgi:hypothetical protein